MINDQQKLDVARHVLEVMRKHYPAAVADWRMAPQTAEFRMAVMEAIVQDYTKSNGDGPNAKAG